MHPRGVVRTPALGVAGERSLLEGSGAGSEIGIQRSLSHVSTPYFGGQTENPPRPNGRDLGSGSRMLAAVSDDTPRMGS
jgi:hypothetical protein